MRIIYINGIFKLPDDFEGNLSQAIREWLAYRQTEETKDRREKAKNNRPVGSEPKDIPDKLWNRAMSAFNSGYRFEGDIFCGKHENGEWKNFELD